MTKEQKAKALIEAIYNATRQGISVTFSEDSPGQMTVTLGGNGDGHTHVGNPGYSSSQHPLPMMIDDAEKFINGALGVKQS